MFRYLPRELLEFVGACIKALDTAVFEFALEEGLVSGCCEQWIDLQFE